MFVHEVEKDLQQVLVIVVTVPALRGDALARLQHDAADVEAYSSFDHIPDVRVRQVEEAAATRRS